MQRDRLRQLLERTMDPAFALTARAVDLGVESGGRGDHGLQSRGHPAPVIPGAASSFDLKLKTASAASIWLNVSVLVFQPLRSGPALLVHLAHDITASRRRRALFERLRETAREITQLADKEHHLVPVALLTPQERGC